jgi:hypothetical protein
MHRMVPPTNLGWSDRDTFFRNRASHMIEVLQELCLKRTITDLSFMLYVVFGTQG